MPERINDTSFDIVEPSGTERILTPELLLPEMVRVTRNIQGCLWDASGTLHTGGPNFAQLRGLDQAGEITTYWSLAPQFLQKGIVSERRAKALIDTSTNLSLCGFRPLGRRRVERTYVAGAILDTVDIMRQSGMDEADVRTYFDYMQQSARDQGFRLPPGFERLIDGPPGAERGAYYGMQALDVYQALERFRTKFGNDPDKFLQHTLINTIIYGPASRIEGTEQFYVRYASELWKDRHRTLVDGHHMLIDLGSKAFKSADHKHLYVGEIQFNPEPKHFQELIRFSVPVELIFSDGTVRRGEIGPADFLDVWEENPMVAAKDGKRYPLRELLASNNYNVSEEAGEGGILAEVFRKKLGYVKDPDNPIVKTNLWRDKPVAEDLTKFEEDPIDDDAKLWQWAVGPYIAALPYIDLTLRRIYYDTSFQGQVHYEGRPELAPDNYDTMYSKYLYESRNHNSWWYCLLSEYGTKLVPVLGMQNKAAVVEMRKGMRDDDPRRELLDLPEDQCFIDIKAGLAANCDKPENANTPDGIKYRRRKEILEWIYYDNPLPTYLKPFEQAIALGQKVTVDMTLYPGLKGLDRDSLVARGINPSLVSHREFEAAGILGRVNKSIRKHYVTIDFGSMELGRHFLMQNRIPKGWLRGTQELQEIWEGLTDEEKRLFDGISFKPALVAQQQDVSASTVVDGSVGLDRVIKSHSPRHYLFELLARTDIGRYFNYLARQKDNLALMEACHMAMNLVGKTDVLVPTSALDTSGQETISYMGKQTEEMVKAFTELTSSGFVPVPTAQKALVFRETFIAAVIENIDIVNRRIQKVVSPAIRYDPVSSGDSWDLVPLSSSDVARAGRTEVDLRRKLGFRINRIGGGDVLIAAGGHKANRAINITEGSSAPMLDQFGSRTLYLKPLVDVMMLAGFDRQQVARPKKIGDTSVGKELMEWLKKMEAQDIIIPNPEYTEKETKDLANKAINPLSTGGLGS